MKLIIKVINKQAGKKKEGEATIRTPVQTTFNNGAFIKAELEFTEEMTKEYIRVISEEGIEGLDKWLNKEAKNHIEKEYLRYEILLEHNNVSM